MAVATVSRAGELRAVDDLLASLDTGPSGLVITGEPGIGKTTLWVAGVARARELGFHVLAARADEAESVMAYALVADLLEDVAPDVIDGLPDLQRVAVDRVLLRASTDGPPTDHRVTASAMVSIITALAEVKPVLLAVDDVQWLDVSSQAVLAFAARRLGGRVGVLLTERAHTGQAEPATWLQLRNPDTVTRVRVGPLSLGALHTMIVERLGRALPRPTMVRISEVSGGNPFYALELARSVEGRSSGEDAVLPNTLAELMRLRIGHFDGEVGDLLLLACCVTDATVDLLAHAAEVTVERVVELLEDPEGEGIVRIDGNRVVFAHPLLARGIYTHAGPARRRRMHRLLATVETQPELKARHLALGAASAEPEVLIALDEAADSAAARGAAAAAADFCDLAIGLGGDTPDRRVRAAEQHFRAGDVHQARAVLEPVVNDVGPGSSRADARLLLGDIHVAEHDYLGATRLFEAAVNEAQGDLAVLARCQLALSRAHTMSGRPDVALHDAEAAVLNAERLGDPKLISQALALHVMLTFTQGLGRDEPALQRALKLEAPDLYIGAPFQPSTADAITKGWSGRLDEALVGLVAARRRCVEIGAESDLMYVSGHLAMVYVWLGRYSVAADVADGLLRRGEQSGGGGYPIVVARSQRALASAYLGRERVARNDAQAAIAGARQCGSPFLGTWPLMTLGFLEVSLGNFEKALNVLQPLLARAATDSGTEIFSATYMPDAVEALVAVGRHDDAIPLIEALEHNGARHDRPWMLAVGARSRSMLFAARGELVGAEACLQHALVQHDRISMPFERARTQLLHGRVLRRQRRKQLAATAMSEALAVFEELGTSLWADRARAELVRMDVPRTGNSDLTPAELRVARHAASGMSNKDIATALFISPKTVEHNLSSVYRKLAVRTRAELASRADELGEG